MSTEVKLPVELSASYAHRADTDVHIVLQLTGDLAGDLAGGDPSSGTELRLRAGRRTVRATATASSTPEGTALDARVPVADLQPGVWHIGLVGPDGDVRGVEARLLTSTKQPIALLPGPVPRTELPAPRPAEPRSRPARERAYHAAAKVADRGLRLLPDQRADRVRTVLRRAGRRVLS